MRSLLVFLLLVSFPARVKPQASAEERVKVKVRSAQSWQRTTLCSPKVSSWLSSNQ